ncbi:hypothetical protein CesoFtcFv8_018450 [Champsocephalus esox]|uniref:SH3 and cysteine-rich domain-containing protein 2 n=1 Tax=Champsocephalus esox TaxID=159716 RepID=A0AAN8BGB0_9TELE|nr:hypothetical protein CesoFtcFv8_018450 [Champsocephalus esox]
MMTENNEMQSDTQLQRSPSTMSIQPMSSKLQRLKRSMSFKTIMRSKSVENFFQSLSPSLSIKPLQPQITHCFQDHVFRKPTNCQHCKHMIVGNSKQALRCKTCKMAAHLWCTSELSQQLCYGKSGAFKRNFSSPLLVNDQLSVVKEVQPSQEAARMRVDPVYAALRFGTSLAHMSRSSFGSLSESPTRSLGEGGEEMQQRQYSMDEEITQETGDNPFPDAEMEEEEESGSQLNLAEAPDPAEENNVMVPKRIEVHSIHTYVALYKFLPQEQNDLELQPGDRVQVTDDSGEEWWKGKSGDKVGFFPANFVQRVRPGERVWRVVQGFPGNRERGHMAVKESQICVGKREEGDVFMKLSSGKKRGLVPADSIEEI